MNEFWRRERDLICRDENASIKEKKSNQPLLLFPPLHLSPSPPFPPVILVNTEKETTLSTEVKEGEKDWKGLQLWPWLHPFPNKENKKEEEEQEKIRRELESFNIFRKPGLEF